MITCTGICAFDFGFSVITTSACDDEDLSALVFCVAASTVLAEWLIDGDDDVDLSR